MPSRVTTRGARPVDAPKAADAPAQGTSTEQPHPPAQMQRGQLDPTSALPARSPAALSQLPSAAIARSDAVQSALSLRTGKRDTVLRDDARDRFVANIARNWGPVLERDQAPALYGFLDDALEKLTAAVQERLSGVVVSDIFIVDSPVQNAAVQPDKKQGVGILGGNAVITTGLLKELLPKNKTPLSTDDLAPIVGVLAHEVAHLVPGNEREGSDTDCWKHGSQAVELRADIEGTLLLRECGYPTDALLRGLSTMRDALAAADKSTESQRVLRAGLSSHPTFELRVAGLRALLTLERYESASPSGAVSADPGQAEACLLELTQVDARTARWKFSPPQSLHEATVRMWALENEGDYTYRDVEFRRLLLSFDLLLIDQGQDLTPEERQTALDFLMRVDTWHRMYDGSNAKEAPAYLTKELGAEHLAGLDHQELLSKSPLAQAPELIAWARERLLPEIPPESEWKWLSDTDKRRFDIREQLDRANAVLPAQTLLGEFGDRLQARIDKERPNIWSAGEVGDYLAVRHAAATWAKSSPTEKLNSAILAFGEPRSASRALRDATSPLRAQLQKQAWRERGMLAVAATLANVPFQWEPVFAAVGLTPEAGHKELRGAAKAYLQKQQGEVPLSYAELLEHYAQEEETYSLNGAWLDAECFELIAGTHNRAVQDHPERQAQAWKLATGPYLYRFREAADHVLNARLTTAFSTAPQNLDDIRRVASMALEEMGVRSGGSNEGFGVDVLAGAVMKSGWPVALKRAVLSAAYLDPKEKLPLSRLAASPNWLSRLADKDAKARAVVSALIACGAVADELDLLRKLGNADLGYKIAYAIRGFADDIAARFAKLNGASDRARFWELLDAVFPDAYFGELREAASRRLKAAVLTAASQVLTDPAELAHAFERITTSGAIDHSDAFFSQYVLPHFIEDRQKLAEYLRSHVFASDKLRLRLTRLVLEPELVHLENLRQHAQALGRARPGQLARDTRALIATLDEFAPTASQAKDEYLEEIAWRLGLAGRELAGFIEDKKSYNWRAANPMLVNVGSTLSEAILNLTKQERHDLLRYVMRPDRERFPDSLNQRLTKVVARNAANVDDTTTDIRYQFEQMMLDASSFERIPLIEMVLASGADALAKDANSFRHISRSFLGYAEGSTEEKLLEAFLEVIPAHERSVSLAYLLSQAGEDKSSVRRIFEVFQTVGIKLGQLASVWKVFGDEVAGECRGLADNARPMSKHEVEQALKDTLTQEERGCIKRLVRVLGSASLKTVVEVELEGGKHAVVMVQRPNARAQIQSNLALSRAFLERAEAHDIAVPTSMLRALTMAMQEQLDEELDMRREAENLDRAAEAYESLNTSLARVLETAAKRQRGARGTSWRFRVPRLVEGFRVRENLMVMERASGCAFDKLPDATGRALGEALVHGSLRLLFRNGVFDPDRHVGNWLVDEASGTIYPLDFGQLENFGSNGPLTYDDRLPLADFVRAIGENDAEGIVDAALLMARPSSRYRHRPLLAARVREALATAASESSNDAERAAKSVVGIITALAEQDVILKKKFFFGGLKGLLTLYGAGYVATDEFQHALETEVARLLKVKLPALAMQRARTKWGARLGGAGLLFR